MSPAHTVGWSGRAVVTPSCSPLRLISFAEFRSFESLLTKADAVSQMAFLMFDREHRGRVSYSKWYTLLQMSERLRDMDQGNVERIWMSGWVWCGCVCVPVSVLSMLLNCYSTSIHSAVPVCVSNCVSVCESFLHV